MLSCSAMAAQTAMPSVQANGSATLTAKPNQAQLDIGVVTIGATAQEASQKNASLSDTVQAALSKVLGSAGTGCRCRNWRFAGGSNTDSRIVLRSPALGCAHVDDRKLDADFGCSDGELSSSAPRRIHQPD
jgi:hypothetical protein